MTCLVTVIGLLSAGLPPTSDSDRAVNVRSRRPTADDGVAMWRLAADTTLDDNSPYAYVLWGDQFSSTSRVVIDGADNVVGFVMGHRIPARPDCLFVWQIGVSDAVRGQGVASELLDGLWESVDDVEYLEATVTPSNTASDRLFRSFALRHGGELSRTLVYGEEMFPEGAGHEAEFSYRIGPIPHEG
ncbi:MAG: diaminobutyrate acetyltransferase [Microthrixaceae bacterium]